jgi:hypothetical protein
MKAMTPFPDREELKIQVDAFGTDWAASKDCGGTGTCGEKYGYVTLFLT